MKNNSFYKTLFGLTAVIAAQNLVSFGVNLADSVMLGGYSEAALSGAATANQIQFLVQMLTAGVGEGVVVIASQYWGKRDAAPIRPVVAAALAVGFVAAVVIAVASFVMPTEIISLLTDKPAVIAEGAKYLRVVAPSYVPFFITYTLVAMLRAVETTRIGLVVAATAFVVNVVGNYALIYGHWGAPEMGSAGAATATLVSRIVEFAVVAVYVFKMDKKIALRIRDLFRYDKSLTSDYMMAGLPVIASSVLWALGSFAQTAILGRLADEGALAANSIAVTVFQLFSVFVYAQASAAGVIIGKTVGDGDIRAVKVYAKRLQWIFAASGVVTGLLIFAAKDFMLSFYAISEDSRTLAAAFITILAVTSVGTAYQMSCLTGIVRNGGDTRFVLVNDMIFVWLVVIPSALIAAFVLDLPAPVVFCCLKSDQILKCFVAAVKVNRFRWIRRWAR